MSTTETKATAPKRQRAPRRNYEKIVSGLQQYCEIRIEVLEDLDKAAVPGAVPPSHNAQITAYRNVLARLNG